MSAATSSLRISSLQFSLRTLLLLMFFVGVGIVVFRWPWEEEEKMASGEIRRTHFRLAWNGKRVKHGREVTGDLVAHGGWERWYEDGAMRLERSWTKGIVDSEKHYLNGQLHGVCWDKHKEGKYDSRGEYRHNQKHGAWTYEIDGIVSREEWRENKQHGRTIWETQGGRPLQSAEYENGKLTKWNDLPVAEALEKWLATNVPDAETRRMLTTRIPPSAAIKITPTQEGCSTFEWKSQPDDSQLLVVHFDPLHLDDNGEFHGNVLGEVLLDKALQNWHAFAFRFHRLYVVPINAASLDWQDRTGVYDVRFEEGSAQAQFWIEPAVPESKLPPGTIPPPFNNIGEVEVALFQSLFEVKGQRAILLDTNALLKNAPGDSRIHRIFPHENIPRTRRDLFGHHLDREGCYVEQEGNKLIIKRHAE